MILIWGSTPLAAELRQKLPNARWLEDEAQLAQIPKPDLIILAAPAWYTATVIRLLSQIYAQSAPTLLSLQNGVGNIERFDSVFGAGHVIAGVASTGGLALQEDHPRSREMAQLLQNAGFKVLLGPASDLLWSSVWWGLQANAISSLLNIPPQEVYRRADLFEWEHAQLLEALAILRHAKIQLTNLPGLSVTGMVAELERLPKSILRRTLARYPRPPSLRQDFAQGRSDAAYFNGAIAILAHQHQLRAPLNHALALTLTDLAEGRERDMDEKRLGAILRLALG